MSAMSDIDIPADGNGEVNGHNDNEDGIKYHREERAKYEGGVNYSHENGKPHGSPRLDRIPKHEDGASLSACVNSDTRMCVAPCTDIALKWRRPPKKVLIIKKRDDPVLTAHVAQIAEYLTTTYNIKPLIEPSAQEDLPHLAAIPEEHMPLSCTTIDFIVCLGGDGSLLHVNSLFVGRVPPVLAFFCGTLGFLTPFHIDNFREEIDRVVKGEAHLTARARLHCSLFRSEYKEVDPNEESGTRLSDRQDFHVLNECVLDRGPSPYLTELTCYCNDTQITTVRADGIIVSSATGSTAYSLSAGASMVHPLVPSIVFTPICPHSLSFRPVIFPNCVQLKLQVPKTARNSAWVSFDGRFRKKLDAGEYVIIESSPWCFPSITKPGVNEWFKDIANILHWNDKPSH